MRIAEMMSPEKKFISLEFFPPKDEAAWPRFFTEVQELSSIDPLFVSVTYGAGGSTQSNTLRLVRRLKQMGLEPMAHLTCVGASATALHEFLQALQDDGIENVLALRGDPPQGQDTFVPDNEAFQHASDLVRFIRDEYPRLGVGVAGYPEGHQEAPDFDTDLKYLALKFQSGGDFTITQMFFDNSMYWEMLEKARKKGIDKPIVPGILPIMHLNTVKKISSLCGATVPPAFLRQLETAEADGGPEAVKEVGIAYATEQVRDLLAGGAPGVHLYTLNKSEACLRIYRQLNACLCE
ncbi:MAG: methylenetetrahydrofolate reductase [NAD(P)H] [Desulfohalobium sp.]